MRQNFRKILTMLTVSAAALGLTACGSTATVDEISYDESYLESVADFLIGNWDGMSDEQIAQYAEMDACLLYTSWPGSAYLPVPKKRISSWSL